VLVTYTAHRSGAVRHVPGEPILYAMGITQHTCGAQNSRTSRTYSRSWATWGVPVAASTRCAGIHNVQGSTDMGLLYGNIRLLGKPGTQVAAPRTEPISSASTWTPVGNPLSGDGYTHDDEPSHVGR